MSMLKFMLILQYTFVEIGIRLGQGEIYAGSIILKFNVINNMKVKKKRENEQYYIFNFQA